MATGRAFGNTEIQPLPNHYPSPRPYRYRVPLSLWCQQVESCRASPVQFHQPGMGRPPAPISTADDELHWGEATEAEPCRPVPKGVVFAR